MMLSMEEKKSLFWRSVTVFIGGVIGVGIFGLPYVFAQAGVAIGLAHLLGLAAVIAIITRAYADLVLLSPGQPRLAGVVRRYLGAPWARLSAGIFMLGAWGALLAYIIVGGTFWHAIFSPMLGGENFWYQIAFFLVSSFLLIGGLSLVSRLEVVLVSLMGLLIAVIVAGSLPYVNPANLVTVDWSAALTPFGAILFALGGLGVIPEMASVLGKRNHGSFHKAILLGLSAVVLIYAIFAVVIVSVSGARTSPEGLIGLGQITGNWLSMIGAAIGSVTVFGSFLMLGTEMINLLTFDYKRRYLASWFVVIAVPITLFLLGQHNFIEVINFVGGVLTTIIGGLIIASYLRAKKDPATPKRSLAVPNWALYLCGVIYLVAALSTLLSK
jgi:amino acid permease